MQPMAAAIKGIARDRLRRHRHDADAGRRLRADRVRARPHRPAVPRIRADAGRRGGRLGLRRADADADDVLASCCGTTSNPGRIFPAHRARRSPRSSAATGDLLTATLQVRPLIGPGRARGRRHRRLLSSRSCARSWPRSRIAASSSCAARRPKASTIDYHRAATARRSRAILREVPEVAATSGHQRRARSHRRSSAIGRLKDWDERERTQQSIVGRARAEAARASPASMPSPATRLASASAAASRPIEFVIQTLGHLRGAAGVRRPDDRADRARTPACTDRRHRPQAQHAGVPRSSIDRAKVADLGLDVSVVGRTLETLLGGRQVTRFELNGEQYDVIVQLAAEDRATPADAVDASSCAAAAAR